MSGLVGILKSLYCIPCLWSIFCLLGGYFTNIYIRNIWVPGGEATPADGPIYGFTSKTAYIEWWDTNPLRTRTAAKWTVIVMMVWAFGAGIELVALTWK